MKIVSVFAAMLVSLLFGAPAAEEAAVVPTVETPVEITAAPSASPEVEALLIYSPKLEGEWSGYWEIFSASGAWAEMKNVRWDCWAEMREDDVLYIWDEDLDKDTGLASLQLEQKDGEFVVSGGWFMDNESGFDQWRVTLDEDGEGLQLKLRGNYLSEVNGNFSFVMYLSPQK